MTETPRSHVDRIFNTKQNNEEFAAELESIASNSFPDQSIFSKLLNAANGAITLSPEDADQIISVICKTMNSGELCRPREETTAAIADLLGSTALSSDDALLKYLTTNFTRLEHQNADQEFEVNPPATPSSASKRITSDVRPVPIVLQLSASLYLQHSLQIFASHFYLFSFLFIIVFIFIYLIIWLTFISLLCPFLIFCLLDFKTNMW